MKITGTRGQYPDVDGVQVSIGSDFVVMSSQRGWEMLDPYDARELAAHLTQGREPCHRRGSRKSSVRTGRRMTARSARPSVTISEAQLQDTIVLAARTLGFLAYHTTDARLNEPGFPDLIIVGYGKMIVWELKTARGKLRPASATKKGRALAGTGRLAQRLCRGRYSAGSHPT